MGNVPAMTMNDDVFEAISVRRSRTGHAKLARVCRAKFDCIIHSLLTFPHMR